MSHKNPCDLIQLVAHLPIYQYQEVLTGREIRLLKLLWIEESGLTHFQLRKSLLPCADTNPSVSCEPYIALSYAWGDESNKLPIVVDGQRIMITRNFFAALAYLSAEFQENEV